MPISRIAGIVICIIGIGLLITGLNASDSAADQISETLVGSYTDQTIWYLIAGGAAAIGGFILMMFGAKAR
ncbi:DUF3185 family protein [Thalassospira lucentensis]|uniref:DUF3185 family protein n=1 Tax=Thalassospira lucentensis TaxID=168935 RepID=UPI003D2F2AB1